MIISKITSIEIDSELFFNNVSDIATSWMFNLYDLEDHEPIYNYIKETEPEIITALETKQIDYVEVYRDF